MTYALSASLQQAIFTTLANDPALTGQVGTNIFDAAPSGAGPDLYVVIGHEKVRDRSDQTVAGAWHDFEISVVSNDAGFLGAKMVAASVCDALLGEVAPMARGSLVSITFQSAKAARIEAGTRRQIDLKFRAFVTDSQAL